MSDITFRSYDVTSRVPGVYAEIVPAGNGGAQQQRALLIGQAQTGLLAAGDAGRPVIIAGAADVQARYGGRSQLALAFALYRLNDPNGEVWALPLAETTGAAAATGTITFAGTATSAATLALYVDDVRVQVPVATGDTATAVAAAAADAINATLVPVTAAASGAAVTLTSTMKGTIGNDCPVKVNFGGTPAGEALPDGITATVVAQSGGTGTPTLPDALALLGDTPFDFIVCPFADTTSLDAMRDFLGDESGRWNWENQLFGGFFAAKQGTVAQRVTFGTARNDEHGGILGFYNAPGAAWRWATAFGAACAASIRANPAVPLQNVTLVGIRAPAPADRDPPVVRNSMLYDGLSTYKVADDGSVVLDRSVTTYQKNTAGVADDSWLDLETPYQLAYCVRDMKAFLASRYSRSILVADGTIIDGGSAMVTAQMVLASTMPRYRGYCDAGVAQNYDVFKANARAQNLGKGVVALYLPFDVANQLRVIAMLVQFSKS